MRHVALIRCILLPLLIMPAVTIARGQQAGSSQPSTEPAPQFTFRVTTREVLVVVVATGRHGEPIRDLTQQDFQIVASGSHQEKAPQKISTFTVLNPALQDAADDTLRTGCRIPLGGDCAQR